MSPERSDDVESDRRSSPRFPAELLGKASVRLLGGFRITLINFSDRGLLFQSETRLLVGARGTIRIVVGTETTIAAGTVVRLLVQGMASGKLAFHTALALDQPLAVAAAVEARERAKVPAAPPQWRHRSKRPLRRRRRLPPAAPPARRLEKKIAEGIRGQAAGVRSGDAGRTARARQRGCAGFDAAGRRGADRPCRAPA